MQVVTMVVKQPSKLLRKHSEFDSRHLLQYYAQVVEWHTRGV